MRCLTGQVQCGFLLVFIAEQLKLKSVCVTEHHSWKPSLAEGLPLDAWSDYGSLVAVYFLMRCLCLSVLCPRKVLIDLMMFRGDAGWVLIVIRVLRDTR